MQPPGKRMKRGRMAAIFSARSLRSPFSRPLKVSCGNSETMSRSTWVPAAAPPTITARRPAVVVALAVSSPVYFFQAPSVSVTSAAAYSVAPAASSTAMRTGRSAVPSRRAQKEKS